MNALRFFSVIDDFVLIRLVLRPCSYLFFSSSFFLPGNGNMVGRRGIWMFVYYFPPSPGAPCLLLP